jgi:WD40 repeat protein
VLAPLARLPFKTQTHAVAFSADGRVGAASTPAQLQVWYTKSGQQVRLWDVRSNPQAQLAIVPEASAVVAFGPDLTAWDYLTGKELWSDKPESVGRTLQAIPKSKRLVFAFGSNNLIMTIRDGATGKELHRWESPARGGVQAVTVANDGQTLVSYGSLDKQVRLWNIPAVDKKP